MGDSKIYNCIGVTDHIICDSLLFLQSSLVLNSFVSLPNGYKALVVSIGTVKLNSKLILICVVFILTVNFNLLSVSRLFDS